MVMLSREWQPSLLALIDLLGGGEETRLVGGAVRDGLLGMPVSDVDLATRLIPDEVLARLRKGSIKGVPTGIAHGTVTAVTADGPVEVTTLRRDVATDGRHATVAFADDWREDAARRDFTINALYANAASGEVFDWFGGIDDLQDRRVRFIGDPLTRIAEDHLRILRFFRFHARFGNGDADGAALAACGARANDLMALSRERVAAELLKLLTVDDPVPSVRTMITAGIFRPVLPEVTSADALARLVGHENGLAVPGQPIRRLAALLPPDADAARAVATRLRLSNADLRRLVLAVSRPTGNWGELAYRHGPDAARDILLLRGTATTRDIALLETSERPVLPITGGALIARGLVPGPIVATTLRAVEEAWIKAGFPGGPAFDAIVAEAISAS